MNGAVHIAGLMVENVGIHTRRLDLGTLSPRLNLISGGNEAGKSTLIAALRAGLFERHDAKHQGIRALQPYATRAAPEVFIELDLNGERLHIHKRFLEKPLSELREVGGGPVRLRGAEADQYLLQKLGGHAPSRNGIKAGDMGLWGLLWVSQDETAYSDPVALLDEKKDPQAEQVRGALSELIGRQVGQIIGGRQGERVRSRVFEHLAAFYTDKKGTPTGRYRKAIDAKQEADARVGKIEQALLQVEEHAQELRQKKDRLAELERQRPRLEKEHASAHKSVQDASFLHDKAQHLRARYEAEKSSLQAALQAVAARLQMQTERADSNGRIVNLSSELGTREPFAAAQSEAMHEAKARWQAAREKASQHRQALALLSRQLEKERRHLELTALQEQLVLAEAAARELFAKRQQAMRTLDADAYEKLHSLSKEVLALRRLVQTSGTRIVIDAPGREPQCYPVAQSFVGEIEGVGELHLQAARPGLARIGAELSQARSRFEQALHENGVLNLQQARELATAQKSDAQELAQLQTRFSTLAPNGLLTLSDELRELETQHQRLLQQLGAAQTAAIEADELRALLDADPFDEAALKDLRTLDQNVQSAHAACAQVGTLFGLHAQKDIQIRLGDADPLLLQAGETLPAQPLTVQTTVQIGDFLQLSLEPRGQDLTRLRAAQERAEFELQKRLLQLEVSDLQAAELRASARAHRLFAKEAATQRLLAAAPKGIVALQQAAERCGRQRADVEKACKEARQLESRMQIVLERHRSNRIHEQVLARMENLAREQSRLQDEQQNFAARLVLVQGPLCAQLQVGQVQLVAERLHLELADGLCVTIHPGDTDAGEALARTEAQLLAALRQCELTDIAAAESSYHDGIALREQVADLRQRLCALSPSGIEALQDLLTRKNAALQELAAVPPLADCTDPALLLQQAEDALRTAEQEADDAELAVNLRHQTCIELDREIAHQRSRLESERNQYEKLSLRLEMARHIENDAALDARSRQAEQACQAAHLQWQGSQEELAALSLDGLQEEEARAKKTLHDWEEARRKLQGEVVRLQTLLEQAASEGHFEQLTEARVAQESAAAELFRLEREAKAARRLADVVQAVYEEEQQRFLAPVLSESQPYLRVLRPGTALHLGANFKLEKVSRHGTDEDFGQLSGGTREQLAVIVRLALARVLSKASRPLPLILDDPMGWTDDDRFLAMMRILREASRELQVIVLTCHPERFLRLQAEYRFDLDAAKQMAKQRVDTEQSFRHGETAALIEGIT